MTGTLYEGGTRGIGFIHSPLLERTGYTSVNLMHAVDWLPTLMTAIGRPGLATSATDGDHHHYHHHYHPNYCLAWPKTMIGLTLHILEIAKQSSDKSPSDSHLDQFRSF